jgi:branched-chain amino acid transport system permease protein
MTSFAPEDVAARRRRLLTTVAGMAALLALPQMPWVRRSDIALMLGFAFCYGLVGMSVNVLTGYAGQISLGQGALFGTGAFAAAHLVGLRGVPFWIAVPLAGLITGGVVLIMGIPALRVRGLHLAIVTLAFQFLMSRVVLKQDFVTSGQSSLSAERPAFLGHPLDLHREYVYVILAFVFVIWWIDRNLTRTRAGRAFLAIREDEQVASSFGIDVARYKLLAFVLSGIYAGIAGGLFAFLIGEVSVETYDYQLSLEFLAYATIGGLGSRAGTMYAAMIPVFFAQLLQGLRSWGVVLGGFLLILTLVRYRGGVAEQGREIAHLVGLLWKRRRGAAAPEDASAAAEVDVIDVVSHAAVADATRTRPAWRAARPRATSTAPLLALGDVSIRFGGVQALGGVSLEVRESEIVGIMGPNGAGKTTLFNCVSGFVRPQAGTIRFRGRDILSDPPHARAVLGLGRTFQNIGLVKSETVEANLLIAQHAVAGYGPVEGMLRTAEVQRIELRLGERAREATSLLGLEPVLGRRVHDLPHGLLKIVELGAALVTGPELLLLDEPSSGMGPGEAEELGGTLQRIRDVFDVTVCMIEHHVPLVLAVADYVYVLNFGRLLAEGEASEISSHPEVIAAYLGESDEALEEGLVEEVL